MHERKKGGKNLRKYKLFKENFHLEYYLAVVATIKYRIALTKIRVSCHRLVIETGRYHKLASFPFVYTLISTSRYQKRK